MHKDVLTLDLSELDLDNKDQVRDLTTERLNTIEELFQANQELREEGQRPKDEINWLKGKNADRKWCTMC